MYIYLIMKNDIWFKLFNRKKYSFFYSDTKQPRFSKFPKNYIITKLIGEIKTDANNIPKMSFEQHYLDVKGWIGG